VESPECPLCARVTVSSGPLHAFRIVRLPETITMLSRQPLAGQQASLTRLLARTLRPRLNRGNGHPAHNYERSFAGFADIRRCTAALSEGNHEPYVRQPDRDLPF
jgi:hypothetical protein